MKIEKKEIPEEMKKTILEVDKPIKEKNTITILKELREDEERNKKNDKRATFFINLIFTLSLGIFVYMITKGLTYYALPALGLTAVGAFIFNLFVYSKSKETKQRQEKIDEFYLSNELKKTN
jgi:Na+/H+ antiporter NhaC